MNSPYSGSPRGISFGVNTGAWVNSSTVTAATDVVPADVVPAELDSPPDGLIGLELPPSPPHPLHKTQTTLPKINVRTIEINPLLRQEVKCII